jgi:adenosylcobinamide kinase / adenosylcobinamide-phosphate guanylyltransferase
MSIDRQLILITGAARSGKSEWAETLAKNSDRRVTYIATAIVDDTDPEWQERILQHQQRRPTSWQTQTAITDLAAEIDRYTDRDFLLIDSLGTWVANLLDRSPSAWDQIRQSLLRSLAGSPATIAIVAEETGWGVVPAYPSGRLFRDRLGHLSRQIGSISTTVYLVTGGHVLNLSHLGTPLEPELS